MEVLVVGERGALEDLEGVDNREAAVELAAGDVVVEVLALAVESERSWRVHHGEPMSAGTHVLVPLDSLLRHALALEVGEELLGDLVKDALETRARRSLVRLVRHYEILGVGSWVKEKKTKKSRNMTRTRRR